jgi:hypothetical protein
VQRAEAARKRETSGVDFAEVDEELGLHLGIARGELRQTFEQGVIGSRGQRERGARHVESFPG